MITKLSTYEIRCDLCGCGTIVHVHTAERPTLQNGWKSIEMPPDATSNVPHIEDCCPNCVSKQR